MAAHERINLDEYDSVSSLLEKALDQAKASGFPIDVITMEIIRLQASLISLELCFQGGGPRPAAEYVSNHLNSAGAQLDIIKTLVVAAYESTAAQAGAGAGAGK